MYQYFYIYIYIYIIYIYTTYDVTILSHDIGKRIKNKFFLQSKKSKTRKKYYSNQKKSFPTKDHKQQHQ